MPIAAATPRQAGLALALALAWAAPAGAGPAVDQRSPQYQLTMDRLAAARDALDAARESLRAAEQSNPLPGFRIDRMRQDVTRIQKTLENYLVPRERRYKYQQLQPDGAYFDPEATPD